MNGSDIIVCMRNYLISLVTMIGVYYLHQYGLDGAYIYVWWLDVVVHGLVCFSIAVLLGGFISTLFPHLKYKKTLIIGTTFAIGVAWEWLEIQYGITGYTLWSTPYIQDTLQDFVMDTLGATLGALISTRSLRWKFGTRVSVEPAMSQVKISNK
jgi:hypothetical protein